MRGLRAQHRRSTMQCQLRACQLLGRTGASTADMLVNLLKSAIYMFPSRNEIRFICCLNILWWHVATTSKYPPEGRVLGGRTQYFDCDLVILWFYAIRNINLSTLGLMKQQEAAAVLWAPPASQSLAMLCVEWMLWAQMTWLWGTCLAA